VWSVDIVIVPDTVEEAAGLRVLIGNRNPEDCVLAEKSATQP